MSIGKIVGGVLVCVCVVLIFIFTLKNLLNGMDEKKDSVSEDIATEAVASEPEPEPEPEPEVVSENVVPEVVEEPSTEVATETVSADEPLRKLNLEGLDLDQDYYDTMQDGLSPEHDVDYVVESTKDIQKVWDNGKENYLAFKNFMVIKNYKNEQDLMCDNFVDIMFKDGSSLEGLRCNKVEKLTEKSRFRYGYIVDDATQGNGQNVMYIYLVQE